MSNRCPSCHGRTSGRGRCPDCRAEHAAQGVDHVTETEPICVGCGELAPNGSYSESRRGMWFCPGCSALELRAAERDAVVAATPDVLAGAVQWAVGDDSAYPGRDPGLEAGFAAASLRRAADDDDDLVECCPHEDCRSARFRVNSLSHVGVQADERYRCKDCARAFEQPDERERKHNGETRQGLARKLADPDVSEPADLRADGGDEWAVEQRGLDGEPAEGQTTIDGGVAKDGGEE